MGEYYLSNKATHDLEEIFIFSYTRFGAARAEAYLTALEECFISLAHNPVLGKDVGYIREGYRKYQHVSHAVYYTQQDSSVLIVRVLHAAMQQNNHL